MAGPMRDHFVDARRVVLIACAAILLGVAGYFAIIQPWLTKMTADQQAAQARDVAYRATVRCVEANGSLKDFLTEDSRLIFVGSTCTLNAARLASVNSATYDAAVARCDYATKQARIARATGLCERWAACDKTLSQKAAFDSCYGAFGPTDDDNDDAADDVGDTGDSSDR